MQGLNVVEEPVGIGHRLANMKDRQSRSFGADQTDELAVGNDPPPCIGDQTIQVGNEEREFAGRIPVIGGEDAVAGFAERVYQESHELRIVISDDDTPRVAGLERH